ncbi:radical SAM family heme chaperone HemW [Buchnera aphidicola (Ceratoglyphina bambusae)]|uniref:radical SAM family heme chaperone HemW n=1 Tax=Buchnera aphidicola TaxID=9 RepID=UPI0031B83472
MYKKNIVKEIPISLYIHIPWCIRRCPYCDFNIFIFKRKKKYINKYIKNLHNDLKQDIKLINNRKICSIFIGGGTPTLLNHKEIFILLKKIKKIIKFSKNIEITIEMDPKTLIKNEIKIYYKLGINRISLGIQTFNNKKLFFLKRMYNSNQAIKTIKICKKNKKIKINIDIIHSLPKQTLYEALVDIKKTVKLNPNHISWYKLNIEKNTYFYKKKIKNTKENIFLNILKFGNIILKKHGFKQYEISSYSKKKCISKHNLNYWNYGDYLGIGCGSHSKITKKNGSIIRIIKQKNIKKYNLKKYIYKIKILKKKEIILEFFMNNFRLFKPIFKSDFFKYTNIHSKEINKKIKIAINNGYIKENKKTWETTKKGKNFLNDLLEIFI